MAPHPHRRPDLDKLLRSTLDGIVEAGAIADDAQIVTIRARKRYGPMGASIRIEPCEETT